jgi:uncharacterized protein YndB with AHSA1/START domain
MYDAPLEKVWQAWTDPAQVVQWWGPNGVTNPTCEWDARAGGKINIVMLAGPELGEMAGQEWPMAGEFTEVVPEQRLIYTASPIMDGKPVMDTLTTVTFEAVDGKTKLTVHIAVTRTTEAAAGPLSGMEQGWNQQLDKLKENIGR